MRRVATAAVVAMICAGVLWAQDPPSIAPMNVNAKWKNFVSETLSPITIGAGLFNGAEAHITGTDPKYGSDLPAFGAQVGAAIGDIVSQNFLADFALASEFHEDPRYFPRGLGYSMRSRIGYAISRSVLTRTDDGRTGFNWSNVLGTALSSALSNAYYPPASRNASATFQRWGVGVLGTGLAKLAPEFWPDFRRKVFGKR